MRYCKQLALHRTCPSVTLYQSEYSVEFDNAIQMYLLKLASLGTLVGSYETCHPRPSVTPYQSDYSVEIDNVMRRESVIHMLTSSQIDLLCVERNRMIGQYFQVRSEVGTFVRLARWVAAFVP